MVQGPDRVRGHRQQGASEVTFESQWLGNELAVYDRAEKKVHFLNRVAAWIWEGAHQGRPHEEIVRGLVAEYPEMPEEQLRRDTSQALADLQRAGLLLEPSQNPRG